ncbi:MAG: hypothetical protein QXN05_00965 [Acidilobaceae archaeon]
MTSRLSKNVSTVVEDQVRKILSDISWIDYRLATLGNSEEDQIERKLLNILKTSLLKDLESLLAFKNNGYRVARVEEKAAG